MPANIGFGLAIQAGKLDGARPYARRRDSASAGTEALGRLGSDLQLARPLDSGTAKQAILAIIRSPPNTANRTLDRPRALT